MENGNMKKIKKKVTLQFLVLEKYDILVCKFDFANFAKFWVQDFAFREIPKVRNFVHCNEDAPSTHFIGSKKI